MMLVKGQAEIIKRSWARIAEYVAGDVTNPRLATVLFFVWLIVPFVVWLFF